MLAHSGLAICSRGPHQINKDISCTSKACSWLSPAMQNVRYAPISDINFCSPDTKRRKMLEGPCDRRSLQPSTTQVVKPPSKEEMAKFYSDLSNTDTKPGILSIVPDFSDMFKVEHETLSKPLSLLYNEQCLNMSYTDLLKVCETVFLNITITKEQGARPSKVKGVVQV